MAWHFVTQELQLDRQRLMVTVHQTDQESEALWRKLGMNNVGGRCIACCSFVGCRFNG